MKQINENDGTGGFFQKALNVVKTSPKAHFIIAFGVIAALIMLL